MITFKDMLQKFFRSLIQTMQKYDDNQDFYI